VLPRQLLLLAAVLLALGSTISRSLLYLHYGPSWGTAAYTLIFSRADALMVGVICAILLQDPRWKELLIRKRWATEASCTIFGLGVAVLMYKGWGMGTMPMCTLGFTCLALFYASILILVIITPDGLLSRALRARWLMWLGTISFGLYLLHSIALATVSPILLHHQPETSNWLRAVTAISALVAALCLAWLSWNYFESKMVRLGHRFIYEGRTALRISIS
jgi:peptidoglycan/LPS O-acetylase OafA/YrhL